MKIKRGDIYLADLDKAYGSEQGGVRPVLIIQNNKGNKYSPTTIVAPVTGRAYSKASLPTHYYIPVSAGLKNKSIVMLEQIRVIDQSRLIRYISTLGLQIMTIIDKKIEISLAINNRTIQKKQKLNTHIGFMYRKKYSL